MRKIGLNPVSTLSVTYISKFEEQLNQRCEDLKWANLERHQLAHRLGAIRNDTKGLQPPSIDQLDGIIKKNKTENAEYTADDFTLFATAAAYGVKVLLSIIKRLKQFKNESQLQKFTEGMSQLRDHLDQTCGYRLTLDMLDELLIDLKSLDTTISERKVEARKQKAASTEKVKIRRSPEPKKKLVVGVDCN